MNLKHLSRISLTLTAATGSLALIGFIYIAVGDGNVSTDTEYVQNDLVVPEVTTPKKVVREEAPEPKEPAPEELKDQKELDLNGAISAFATAVAEDNSSLTTRELVHLDALFENLAHQAAQEKSN